MTFAELPSPPSSDEQNKENDQPDEPMPEPEDEEKQFEAPPPQPAPQQQSNGNKVGGAEGDDGQAKIIPWRAQLRKTNSTLNLLE